MHLDGTAGGDLPAVAPFDALPEALRPALTRLARLRTAAAGTVILEDGVEAREVGYVLDGTLGAIKTLEDGRQHIIGLLVPTDMYGRLFEGPADHRIEALTEVRLLCFDRAPFEEILRQSPEFERRVLVSVLDELDAAREWIQLLNGTRVTERLAAFLVILSRRSPSARAGGEVPLVLRVPLRRIDLARYLGVRPESLSRAVHRLAAEGIIAVGETDRFEVLDYPALVTASGGDLILPDRSRD